MLGRPMKPLAYAAALAASALFVAGLCLLANLAVDPLWFWDGNRISGVNLAFNERLAKINRLLPRLARYDCLILGSSRATLLPEADFKGYRCYNLAFSDGRVGELLLYARYLRARGFAPRLLVVGVDRVNFIGGERAPDVPDFIRDGGAPPGLLASYLSLDALDFSWRTLRDDWTHHRYYDAAFHCRIRPRGRPYRPPARIVAAPDARDVHPARAALYVALRRIFPEARALAYVPPVSAWNVAGWVEGGGLDDYLPALATVARAYDGFLDFALPSPMTESRANTYDGSHYAEAVNAEIAAALQQARPALGLDWHALSLPAIDALYRRRSEAFLASLGQEPLAAAPVPSLPPSLR